MQDSIIKISLKVIIMLATITKAFGLSSPPEQHALMPRQINLSGNIVHFSIPENFSRDMPADDMAESIDLADKDIYQDHQKFTLIRRWWDFKDSGFFGKEYGTLMMSIYLKEVSNELTTDTLKPLDFIDIIIHGIKQNIENYDPLMVYSDYFTAYKEEWFNTQRWMKYFQGHTNEPQFATLFAIPITDKQYIIAEFASASNDNIDIRSFVDKYTEPFINNIMRSFKIVYTDNNPAQLAVLKSDAPPLQEMIDDKVQLLEQLK